MKTLTRRVSRTETYYKIKCKRCGKTFESKWSCYKNCDKCRTEIANEKTIKLKVLLIGSQITDIDNDQHSISSITIKTKSGKLFEISGEWGADKTDLNLEEIKSKEE